MLKFLVDGQDLLVSVLMGPYRSREIRIRVGFHMIDEQLRRVMNLKIDGGLT